MEICVQTYSVCYSNKQIGLVICISPASNSRDIAWPISSNCQSNTTVHERRGEERRGEERRGEERRGEGEGEERRGRGRGEERRGRRGEERRGEEREERRGEERRGEERRVFLRETLSSCGKCFEIGYCIDHRPC